MRRGYDKNVPDNQRGYWQVSDLIPKERILAITKDCDKEDCDLSCKYLGGTLLATSTYYNKQGEVMYDDGNWRKDYVCCRSCWGEWVVYPDEENKPVAEKLERQKVE
jgi:hypothetical protein